MDALKRQIIIVAGGKGLRMGMELPKQFIPIGGVPILMRTLQAFHAAELSMAIILVLPHSQISYWYKICKEYHFSIPYVLAEGGANRFESVKNGLAKTVADGLIGVHDGVRPFVAPEVIKLCYETAAEHRAAVPVIDIFETVREIDSGTKNHVVPRDRYKLVQTPQVFEADLLHRAYQQAFSPDFTDDASVVGRLGVPVTLVAGNRENIKITTPFDLKVAESLVG